MSSKGETESYRDQLATIDKRGKRVWVYPIKPQGKYYTARTYLSWFLLAFLFLAPIIKIGGHPLLQFDIIHRHFFIFGLVFWPQDLHLFVLAAITLFVFIIWFTTIWGRLFCGWVCPQTIFLEMLFRKIEYAIEGNGPAQRQLDHQEWNVEKFRKRSLKFSIFFILSFLIGNTFLAYIIGFDALREIVTSPPSEHIVGFVSMIIFSLVFFWVFTWFREQACTLVCPYGRLQGVLLDSNSMVVMYDHKRGEPRAPLSRTTQRVEKGDCVDCSVCVKVCPTGIDIRNGTQLECVNCTACMDACDRTMNGVGFAPGLIRYSSMNQIAQGGKRVFTPRIILYSIFLVLLLVTTTTLMLLRTPIECAILRTTGSLYEELENGNIRNVYTFRGTNKTPRELPLQLTLSGVQGTIQILGPELILPPEGQDETVFSIEIPKKQLFLATTPVRIEIRSDREVLETVSTTFVGPSRSMQQKSEQEEEENEHK